MNRDTDSIAWFPLSAAQRSRWFQYQLDPATRGTHNNTFAARVHGLIEPGDVENALQQLVTIHPMLRTRFRMCNGEPEQCIVSTAETCVASVNAVGWSVEALQQCVLRDALEPFDLSQTPLIRAKLYRRSEDETVILLALDHIVSDGWSYWQILHELGVLLGGQRFDEIAAEAGSYRDYIAWQQEWLTSSAADTQRSYWERSFSAKIQPLRIPTDKSPRGRGGNYHHEVTTVMLDASLAEGLHRLARSQSATLFTVFLAGYAILLHRYTGQEEIVVGSPMPGRSRPEWDRIIGDFVNPIALLIQIDGELTVAEVIRLVRNTSFRGMANQDYPFTKVVERCRPSSAVGEHPLFQTMFVLQKVRGGTDLRALWDVTDDETRVKWGPAELSPFPGQRSGGNSMVSLVLEVLELQAAIRCDFAFDRALYEPETIERLSGYFTMVLRAMVEDPTQKVRELPLLSPRQRHQLLVEFNSTEVEDSDARLIDELVESQAESAPEAVALIFEDKQLSYGELNRRANQLAHRLISSGVRPDDRVALCVERGIEMVVGLLAILKAGGAYVPLDHSYPLDRLAYMLSDSKPVAVLTQAALKERLVTRDRTMSDTLLVQLDGDPDASAITHAPDHNPGRAGSGLMPSSIAYVIYTSGSTGRPKGVMNTAKSLANHIRASASRYGVTNRDVVLQFASVSFDSSLEQIFCALTVGATLVIRGENLWSPTQLCAEAARYGLTIADIPPSYASVLVGANPVMVPSLRLLIIGGEALLAESIKGREPCCVVVNAYGPTEATITATTFTLCHSDDLAHLHGRYVPIGRPVANIRIYILDEQLQPVPIGVAGEIHIGGSGVARGYLNQPELTAARFISDPFNTDAEARLYKTGDLGRWLPDGNIDYLGRNDFQLKIRGFRIEPGEIEARLVEQLPVREAVVIAREDIHREKRLVAYVVPQEGAKLSPVILRNELARHLPDYMVPTAFVIMDALPLTPNGKVDRSALLDPDESAVIRREYEPPLGDAEVSIAELWKELLGVSRVSRHDQFFELGGHSMLALTLAERLTGLGLAANVRMVFLAPTLAALAAAVGEREEVPPVFVAPPNLISAGCTAITPEMLPLVELSQAEIDRIVAKVPGGIGNVQDIYPLGPLQEGILFHHLLEDEGDAYLLRSILAFDNRTRLDAFLNALQEVIHRHDILRSSFHWEDLKQPVQVVHRDARLAVEELNASPENDALAELRARTDPCVLRFNLQCAPLLKGYVVANLASGEWLLALLDHHLVSDHVTLELMLSEVQLLVANQREYLPTAAPYRNFIAQLHRVSPVEHEQYFRQQLEGVTEATAPFGILDIHGDGSRVEEARLGIVPAVARQIREAARKSGVTPAVLFHVAWAQVLARCCGRDDVVFGTVLSGRLEGSRSVERVFGVFINTLPIRIVLGRTDIAQVVRNTHETLAELLRHEHASLALAQRCSAVPPAMPLFTSAFNYRRTHFGNPAGGSTAVGMFWEGIRLVAGEERSNYPLGISVDDFGDGFALTAQTVGEIAADRIVNYLATAIQSLVEGISSGLERAAHRIDILPEPERHQLLVEFNATEAVYPSDRLIHELFEDQVARAPDATALVYENKRLSYDGLNRRANQVAHHLIALGIRPDDRVAICMGRHPDTIVGLLGILKAGGAYVPMDPSFPDERLAYMIEDSAPVALLTQSPLRDRLAAASTLKIPTLLLDGADDLSLLARQAQDDPDPVALGLNSSHLVYVIYTSGSTGLPKGVMIEHRSLCNLAGDQIASFGLEPDSRVLQFASLSFDVSISEATMALCSGACLHLAGREVLHPGAPLIATLQERRITHLSLPLPALAALDGAADLGSVQTLIVGGDALSPSLARHWAGERRLFNAYGPTEATVCATTYRCKTDEEGSVPIGRPIANTKIYILDRYLQPVPLGVSGEIYIGGVGVARGYFNRPELTAERFIACPVQSEPQMRLYKTGDLGRWRPDGNIEYLGRNDFQVKIRGFRVELGEVEARLAAYAGVREAVVMAREDNPGEKRLVAYLVPRDGVELAVATLRDTLSQTLPDYMVPSAFVSLKALPLTPNGKLDRRALPAPDQSAVITRGYEAPIGEVEVAIAEIWQDLLGLEQVGRNDQFFELGGHSLLAMQVVSRLRQRLRVEVALRELFAQPTLGEFAQIVTQAGHGAQPPLLPADRTEPLPLSWAQQRLWFLDQLDQAASAAYHIPAALRLSGKLNQWALQAALDRTVARHESLRTTFVSVEGTPTQVIARAEIGFALRHQDLSSLEGSAQEAAVTELAVAEGSQSFDLATGPLIRGQLLRLADDEHVLLVTQHHIISDGWSIGVLVRELSALYSAFSQEEPDPLPELTIQYADYAVWQRQWLAGEVLQKQVDYWREHLGGAPALLELPTDRPRPGGQSYKGSSMPMTLSPELTARLRALSQRHGTTLFMTLLGAWSALLSRLSGQTDVVIGTPVANRQRSEIEPLIGFFVNTLALRIRLEEDPSVAQLLEQIKGTTLGAYAHQDLPFEQVVEALQPDRSLSYSPLFQAMLVLNNLPNAGTLTLPGLRLAPMETPQITTHFDLTMSLTDSGDVLAGGIEYATDLFDASTVERMMGYFVTLLNAMVGDRSQRISDLPLLLPRERDQLTVQFNDTRTSYPRNALIQELFEEQAGRTPSAVAVVFEDTQLTYDELNRHANRLARRLQELGVGREVPVAIWMDRSLEMVTSILGILKAGGAYVPLDPTYPAERLLFMIRDTGTPVILTQTRFKNNFPDAVVKMLCLDGDQFAEKEDTNLSGEGRADDLAYVMYTSGSTGTPKGVAITHRNVVRLVKGTSYTSFSPDETFLQLAPLSFDASTFEVWGALLNGGKLVVMPPGQASLEDIGNAINEHGVTTLWLTSGLFNAMVDERVDDLRPLRQLLAGGDVLSVPHVRKALRELTSTRLINGYGPTESTTFACCHTIEPDAALNGSVPIGRPIANTTAYILDAKLHPAPIGVTGQLFLGGDGVGRGYWRRPELTAQKFINDPFASEPDARLYETGDLARWLPDGNIDYLARNDSQVKIRGFRIELQEIDARLRGCAGVQDARVIASEYQERDARLIAYIVPSPECAFRISETPALEIADSLEPEDALAQNSFIRDLRASLAQQMPEFMIPAAFVFLAEIPLMANGKLDRSALPSPDHSMMIRCDYEAPVGDVELVIARIWQELLGVDRVGRHDHFFELGGHSLMVITLIERLRQQGLNTNVRNVFITPTLGVLAASVVKHKSLASSAIVPPNLIPPDFGMTLRETSEEFRI